MNRVRTLAAVATLALAAAIVSTPAQAQHWGGGWNGGWGNGYGSYGERSPARAAASAQPSRHIDVETYRAAAAGDALGEGRIVVAGVDGPEADAPGNGETDPESPDKLPVYEAAVVDQLVRQGYDTATAIDPGQVAQVSVSHQVVVPEEAPHKPVSGEMSTMISNRGSGVGLALALDFTKPKKAIIATRLDVRVRDKASGRVLWEGHAEGQAREGEAGLDNGAMAARLAAALFARFPEGRIVDPANPATL